RTTRTAPDKYAAPARSSSPTSARAGAATAPSRDDLRRRRPSTRRPPAFLQASGEESPTPDSGRCSRRAGGPTAPSRPFPPPPTPEFGSAKTFAETLTKHLQEVSHDTHLRVMNRHEPLPKPRETPPTPEERQRMRARMSKNNYGFEKVERLDGNIGYLDLRGFVEAEAGGETAAAAMSFLANT